MPRAAMATMGVEPYGDYTRLGRQRRSRLGSSADGGIVVIEEINSGGNQGNTIGVGESVVAAAGLH